MNKSFLRSRTIRLPGFFRLALAVRGAVLAILWPDRRFLPSDCFIVSCSKSLVHEDLEHFTILMVSKGCLPLTLHIFYDRKNRFWVDRGCVQVVTPKVKIFSYFRLVFSTVKDYRRGVVKNVVLTDFQKGMPFAYLVS